MTEAITSAYADLQRKIEQRFVELSEGQLLCVHEPKSKTREPGDGTVRLSIEQDTHVIESYESCSAPGRMVYARPSDELLRCALGPDRLPEPAPGEGS